ATASTQYGSDSWSAAQATGAPDTHPECGDITTAWASAYSDTIDTLEGSYGVPVFATEVNIYQTYNPNSVVSVELLDTTGTYHEIYSSEPAEADCPLIQTINVEQTPYETVAVRVTVDQSVIGSWNEIDAIELVGIPVDGSAPQPEASTDDEEAPAEPVDFDTPENFLWRQGGPAGIDDDQIAFLGGSDVGPYGLVYLSDNIHGVYVYDAGGNQVTVIDHPDVNNAADVKYNPVNDRIYVAAWGSDSVVVFTAEGEYVTTFGGAGNGPGQFGTFSPQSLAIHPDGRVFVLDEGETDAEEDFVRVQVFDAEGTFLSEFPITESPFSATAMDFSADGTLHVLGVVGGFFLQLDESGNEVGRIGEDALDFTGPQSLHIAPNGHIYVAVWTPASVIELDAAGTQLATYGVEFDPDDDDWPPGALVQPSGAAAAPDGARIYVVDRSGDFAYLNAYGVE
ncbi:MAG: NHL repeat-containing protein, partial [Anaerolineae bacterium]